MATPKARKKQQLDIGLSHVKDKPTRDALSSIVSFVSQLTQSVVAGGDVKGAKVENHRGTAGFNDAGLMSAMALNLAAGGAFKAKMFEGSLGPFGGGSELAKLSVNGRVYGAIGYSQYNGGALWQSMDSSAAGSTNCVFYDPGIGALSDTDFNPSDSAVTIFNADGSDTNAYRVIVFYR